MEEVRRTSGTENENRRESAGMTGTTREMQATCPHTGGGTRDRNAAAREFHLPERTPPDKSRTPP